MSSDIESQRRLASKIIEMSLSVRETEKAVKRIGRNDGQATDKIAVKSKKDANIKAAETKLKRYLATQLQILPDGKGTGGKIEIEYYSESDLDRIYRLILNS
jgi:ParB family chromosome partitioning protein